MRKEGLKNLTPTGHIKDNRYRKKAASNLLYKLKQIDEEQIWQRETEFIKKVFVSDQQKTGNCGEPWPEVTWHTERMYNHREIISEKKSFFSR